MGEENISWKAGEIIYKTGDEPDFAYLLTKGEVEIISDKGTRVGFINEDEVFGELSILLNTKNGYCNYSKRIQSIADSKKLA